MNPRLKSSKKWTNFPQEYSDQIQAVFNETFAKYLTNAELIIEGRIYTDEIVLRVGYLEKARLAQPNFEVSMDYSRNKQDALERIHNCVDAIASMMQDYFENDGEVEIPYLWREYPFQGKKIYLQFSTENSRLEAEANRLLGLAEGELLVEEEDDEDALSRAEIKEDLSPAPPADDESGEEEAQEDEENKGPRMFGGGAKAKKKKPGLH